jgi:hypothetical protein
VKNNPKLVYLASSYSHTNPDIREWRFQAAARAAADLMNQGYYVFSPICHSHPIAITGIISDEDTIDFEFWRNYDFMMIDKCDIFAILKIDGWRESKGVNEEFEYALSKNMPMIEILADASDSLQGDLFE